MISWKPVCGSTAVHEHVQLLFFWKRSILFLIPHVFMSWGMCRSENVLEGLGPPILSAPTICLRYYHQNIIVSLRFDHLNVHRLRKGGWIIFQTEAPPPKPTECLQKFNSSMELCRRECKMLMFISLLVKEVKIGHSGFSIRETGSQKSHRTLCHFSYKQPSPAGDSRGFIALCTLFLQIYRFTKHVNTLAC